MMLKFLEQTSLYTTLIQSINKLTTTLVVLCGDTQVGDAGSICGHSMSN